MLDALPLNFAEMPEAIWLDLCEESGIPVEAMRTLLCGSPCGAQDFMDVEVMNDLRGSGVILLYRDSGTRWDDREFTSGSGPSLFVNYRIIETAGCGDGYGYRTGYGNGDDNE